MGLWEVYIPLRSNFFRVDSIMLFLLFLLFILVPVVELALLIQVGRYLGVLSTVTLVVATGAVGAMLARSKGVPVFRRLQKTLASGSFPGEEIFDGVLILAGGLLLLTPGLITDIIGFAALIPLTRHFFKIYLKRAIHQRLHSDAVQADYKIN